MKFKLDEDIGTRGRDLLCSVGHDVSTVYDQHLGGAADDELFRVCAVEGRVLITLDHDFCHVLRYPPEKSSGIVVLELPPRATLEALINRLKAMLSLLEHHPLENELWIVEPGRIRIHQRNDDRG